MSSYGTSYYAAKGATNLRSSTACSTAPSNYAQSGHSSRNYGAKPAKPVIHNEGGQTYDVNTSSNTGNSGYWK